MDIPGLSTQITLPVRSFVAISASGVQRTTGQGDCHIGYDVKINDVNLGNPQWGSRIHVSNPGVWHSTWKIDRGVTLNAGTYRVSIGASNNGYACNVCAEMDGSLYDYDSCDMLITAAPTGG